MVGKVNIPMSGGSGGTLIINGQDTISCIAKEPISANDPVCCEENLSYTQLTGLSPAPPFTFSVSTFSNDGVYFIGINSTYPYLYIYKEDANNIGTYIKLPNPSVLPSGTPTCMKLSDDSQYLFVGMSGYPYLIMYKRTGDVFTAMAEPGAFPTREVRTIDYQTMPYGSYEKAYLIVACSDAPPTIFLYYERNGVFNNTSFDSGVSVNVTSLAFSKNCESLVIGLYGSPYIKTYYKLGFTFMVSGGMSYTTPNGYICESVASMLFSPDSSFLAVNYQMNAGYRLVIYRRNGTGYYFTSDQNTVDISIGSVRSMAFSPDGKYLVCSHSYPEPYIVILKKVKGVYIKSVSVPSIKASISKYSIAFNNAKNHIAINHNADDSGSYITLYKAQVQSYNAYKADNMEEAILYDGAGYAKQSGAANGAIDVVRLIK